MKALAYNKRAGFDYTLIEKYEAGLILSGQEVKSIKTGHLSLKGSFVTIKGEELFLTNAFIPPYPFAGQLKNYIPDQARKLLVKKSEIRKLIGKVRTEGLTLVPIQVYTRKRLIKLQFALARGKKKFDKRENIKKRDSKRRAQKALKSF
ncbi:MAG: SsrA-binding protein [Candidatus Moranbacteria bacterium GW2011_GWE2_35_2-]|nr:MAG: SsrA-binding protein [Candidatus Moranbacteria bacterium GW2011_GWE2_35_2-]KKQ06773.1 MAG: SsrA-binding protein [Candidatus Moranbacteria bacterium GW2011_GWF1_36_4]KKQ22479.1 MAG: SsrA-binding protein [Candidatus Moranbacteria bacterium GW2011_GWF2_37_11]KKQ29548.1 MAG: SsrA-binding protein [Candidatus Moranbacteria bacterium GW2011_GWD1_37_17]KKQ30582.1 MAG: SsrA-binding protein [Candidatus Moranbacteria bacterium GW2011_GWE1_37_24]KKQ48194.1 MAG: SsrA-binding protein [Candidatus Mor